MDSGPCQTASRAARPPRAAEREPSRARKPGTSLFQVTAVNAVQSDQGTTASKDPVHGELPVAGTHPGGIPEGEAEKGEVLNENTKRVPAGTEYQVEEEATDGSGLKEDNKVVLSGDLQTPREAEGCLEDKAPAPMQQAERNAFSVENGALANNDGSNPSLENGTHLFSPNLNPITQSSSVPSFSAAPSETDCGDDTKIHAEKVAVIQCQDMGDQDPLINGGAGGGHSAGTEGTPRGAKLTTIKKEANFDLRKYDTEKKPTKLFTDDEERQYQTVIITETAGGENLEKQRKEIIKNQAVKKSTTTAEQQVSTKPLLSEEKASLEDSTLLQRSTENANSFPFCKESPVSQPEGINTQQINFTAARQQFLQMERSRQEVPTVPRPSAQSHTVLSQCSTPSGSTQPPHCEDGIALDTSPAIVVKAVRVESVHEDEKGDERSPESPVSNSLFTAEKVASLEGNDGEQTGSMQQNLHAHSSMDDLDSGLGEMTNDYDYGYGHTSDGGASNEMLNLGTDNSCAFECSEPRPIPETPIEKEIRLALEREEVLRKERGIRKSVNSEEMVQIKTKPLLSQVPPASPFSKHKDKNRMVFFVQREIEMDSKREEKLKEEGKVKGLYDKGIPQEVEERKKVFEQQTDDVPVVPQLGWQSKLVSSASQESLDVHTAPEESNTIQADPTECKESSESQPYTLRIWKNQTNILIEQEIEAERRREEELRARRLGQQAAGSVPSTPAPTSETQSPPVHPESTSRAGALNGDQPKDLPVTHSQEGRKVKPLGKKDESSYAGIEPSDDINTEATSTALPKSVTYHQGNKDSS